MEEKYRLFLLALKAALKAEKVTWEGPITQQDWMELFGMAERQHILPLIFEAVYDCPAVKNTDPKMMIMYKQRTIQIVMLQTRKTGDFLALYQKFLEAGAAPVVVKGLICRNLYPNPDYRISGDEDLLIPTGQFSLCHEVMLQSGMECAEKDTDIDLAYEVPYGKKDSPLYIEAHKFLFPPDSEAYGEMNQLFEGMEERTIAVEMGESSGSFATGQSSSVTGSQTETDREETSGGVPVRTMGYTDHLLYLLCHAYKHFLHSGFGIRQVCDVIMMANTHGKEIDWYQILEQCRKIHADQFAAAVFQIGEKYLTFDPDAAHYPKAWRQIRVDEQPLLMDILTGGVYGAVDGGRQHSSTITLNAVIARKHGKKGKANIWRSIFPRASDLRGRYPWLRKLPFLLPVAWICRIKKYIFESMAGKGNSKESIRIGEERVELLRIYGILETEDV